MRVGMQTHRIPCNFLVYGKLGEGSMCRVGAAECLAEAVPSLQDLSLVAFSPQAEFDRRAVLGDGMLAGNFS